MHGNTTTASHKNSFKYLDCTYYSRNQIETPFLNAPELMSGEFPWAIVESADNVIIHTP